jgi:hypothetical protein
MGDQFLGVAIVAASTFDLAILCARLYALHPGGNDQAGLMIEDYTYRLIPAKYLNRILDRATCEQFDAEMCAIMGARNE